MRIFLILAGLAVSLTTLSQEIYRWVDKNGIVHYSDQPDSPDAKLMTVIEPNAYEAEDAAQAAASSANDEEESPEVSPYDSLSIVQPTPDQVFFGADATVSVVTDLGGTLRGDHSLVFFVNGNRRPASSPGGLELSNLERGTYFLRAAVLDQNGEQLIASQQTTFHVRQPSINSPQSPQAPRPAPRPRATPRPATG
ncbi:MAG: DUF4124 domain-containing protein [Steroidobacteraceae bacterium]